MNVLSWSLESPVLAIILVSIIGFTIYEVVHAICETITEAIRQKAIVSCRQIESEHDRWEKARASLKELNKMVEEEKKNKVTTKKSSGINFDKTIPSGEKLPE
jgi:hypothetical protein